MSASLAVIVLKLSTVFNLITTSLTLGLTDLRFTSSCYPASYTVAEKSCTDKNRTLFLVKDLVNAGSSDVFSKAGDEHGTFWMNRSSNFNCTVGVRIDGKVGLKTRSCSIKTHYVCKIKSENAEQIPYADAYIPCLVSTKKGTSQSLPALTTTNYKNTSLETDNSLQTSPMSTNDAIVIAVSLTILIIVIGVSVIVVYLLKRHRKPKKYPVREMSALYHRENPCIDKPTVTSHGDDVTNTGVTIGVGVEKTNGKIDRDSLLKTDTDEVRQGP